MNETKVQASINRIVAGINAPDQARPEAPKAL